MRWCPALFALVDLCGTDYRMKRRRFAGLALVEWYLSASYSVTDQKIAAGMLGGNRR